MKEVRLFLKFYNFYKLFIKEYSFINKTLTYLIKKEIIIVYRPRYYRLLIIFRKISKEA